MRAVISFASGLVVMFFIIGGAKRNPATICGNSSLIKTESLPLELVCRSLWSDGGIF